MKSLFNRVMILAVVALVAVVAGQACAEVIVASYDFEQPAVSVGQLRGQDNWINGYLAVPTVYGPADVFVPASGYDVTQVVRALSTATEATICDIRQTPQMTFTSADTAIALRFWVYTGNNTGGVYGGLGWATSTAAPPLPNMGLVLNSGAMKTYFREGVLGGHSEFYGDTLQTGKWYELEGLMNFATGKFSLSYRNLTDGTGWVADSVLKDMDLNLNHDGHGNYVANGYSIRIDKGTKVDGQYVQYLDNFQVVNLVPEPSSIALLGAGLIGLLAYAWRKRK